MWHSHSCRGFIPKALALPQAVKGRPLPLHVFSGPQASVGNPGHQRQVQRAGVLQATALVGTGLTTLIGRKSSTCSKAHSKLC